MQTTSETYRNLTETARKMTADELQATLKRIARELRSSTNLGYNHSLRIGRTIVRSEISGRGEETAR